MSVRYTSTGHNEMILLLAITVGFKVLQLLLWALKFYRKKFGDEVKAYKNLLQEEQNLSQS